MEIIHLSSTPDQIAADLADFLCREIQTILQKKDLATMAVSGGSTPRKLFSVLAGSYANKIDWSRIHLFWVDERCVPANHPDSNYGMTQETLIQKVGLNPCYIHRIHGENNPESEAIRYSNEITTIVELNNGIPIFDIVLLGVGTDGHTASIFPNLLDSFDSLGITAIAVHPQTLQKRITLTGKVINHAKEIIFHAAGKDKSLLISSILNNKDDNMQYPAAHVTPVNGTLHWFVDSDAQFAFPGPCPPPPTPLRPD